MQSQLLFFIYLNVTLKIALASRFTLYLNVYANSNKLFLKQLKTKS